MKPKITHKTQQIFIISGGRSFYKKSDLTNYLENKLYSLEISPLGWKQNLERDLNQVSHETESTTNYKVFAPKFPNRHNAEYKHWKIVFEKYLALLDSDCIFIRHSLGAVFLSKYFSTLTKSQIVSYETDKMSKRKAILLVAAPYNDESDEDLANFKINKSIENIVKIAKNIYFYNSKDGKVVKISELSKYKQDLSDDSIKDIVKLNKAIIKYNIFKDKGHFNDIYFPEIIKDIVELN
jgi:uncharacterized protein